jgi:acyl-CoA dehydrogenase
MDFRLTDDQIMLKETVRRIASENFAPKAAEIDEKEIFPEENAKILAENGLLGNQIT